MKRGVDQISIDHGDLNAKKKKTENTNEKGKICGDVKSRVESTAQPTSPMKQSIDKIDKDGGPKGQNTENTEGNGSVTGEMENCDGSSKRSTSLMQQDDDRGRNSNQVECKGHKIDRRVVAAIRSMSAEENIDRVKCHKAILKF